MFFKFTSPPSENEQGCTRQSAKAKGGVKRKREARETGSRQEEDEEEEDELQPEVEIDPELDRELESKSRQHNLTSANVRSIIHVSVDDSYRFLNTTKKYATITWRSEV